MVTTVGVFSLVFVFNVTMLGVTVRRVVSLRQSQKVRVKSVFFAVSSCFKKGFLKDNQNQQQIYPPKMSVNLKPCILYSSVA